jgi:trans-aconitate 2-methyltransferase
MSWSAAQYVKFEAERNRPIFDLLARIPDVDIKTAVDIGCGPGNSTELLQVRFPDAQVTGLDSSNDMVEAARKRLPHIDFQVADIANWRAETPVDLILANAVLQWLPDHQTLFPRLIGMLNPGGVLAVQMPDNLDEPSHRLMRKVAAEGPWKDKLATAADSRPERHPAEWYYGILKGLAQVDIWRTTYYHALDGGPDAIVEWFKGSGLRPFLEPLNEDERSAFLDRYRGEIAKAYPAFPDNTVLLPFPRLFIVARRAP